MAGFHRLDTSFKAQGASNLSASLAASGRGFAITQASDGTHLLVGANGSESGWDSGHAYISQLVVDAVTKHFRSCSEALPDRLRNAIAAAEGTLNGEASRNVSLSDGCCTVMALSVSGVRADLCWAGDEQAFLLRCGVIERKTDPHVMARKFVEENALDIREARSHPLASVVTRTIGGARRQKAEPHTRLECLKEPWQLQDGDTVVMASGDALKVLGELDILELADGSHPRLASEALLRALHRGARGGVTVIVGRLN